MRAARAARLFFLIQPIRSLFSGVLVALLKLPNSARREVCDVMMRGDTKTREARAVVKACILHQHAIISLAEMSASSSDRSSFQLFLQVALFKL